MAVLAGAESAHRLDELAGEAGSLAGVVYDLQVAESCGCVAGEALSLGGSTTLEAARVAGLADSHGFILVEFINWAGSIAAETGGQISSRGG